MSGSEPSTRMEKVSSLFVLFAIWRRLPRVWPEIYCPKEIIFWSTLAKSVMFRCFFSQVFLDLSKLVALSKCRWPKKVFFFSTTYVSLAKGLLRSATRFSGLVGASNSLICFFRGLALAGLPSKRLSEISSAVQAFCSIYFDTHCF